MAVSENVQSGEVVANGEGSTQKEGGGLGYEDSKVERAVYILATQAIFAFDAGLKKELVQSFDWVSSGSISSDSQNTVKLPLHDACWAAYSLCSDDEREVAKQRAGALFCDIVDNLRDIDFVAKTRGFKDKLTLAVERVAICEYLFNDKKQLNAITSDIACLADACGGDKTAGSGQHAASCEQVIAADVFQKVKTIKVDMIMHTFAIQAIYAYDAGGDADELQVFPWVASESVDFGMPLTDNDMRWYASLPSEERAAVLDGARLLFCGAVENLQGIDGAIKKHLRKNWRIERINKVVLAILRVTVYELLFCKVKSPFYLIDNAVSITKNYTESETDAAGNFISNKLSKFVNAVLDKMIDRSYHNKDSESAEQK